MLPRAASSRVHTGHAHVVYGLVRLWFHLVRRMT
jgi:hypothetical protein